MKNKFSMKLDAYEVRLLEKAIRIACRLSAGEDIEINHRRFLMRWIVRAVCAAIIREGKMPDMLAVALRHETKDETRARMEKIIPTGPGEDRRFPTSPNQWLN